MSELDFKAIRFLHIPKTAGSTLNAILRRQYPAGSRLHLSGDFEADRKEISAASGGDPQRIKLFTGHAPLNTGIPEVDRAEVFTLLRDPVSRVKSLCQFVSEGKSEVLAAKFPPESFHLEAFLYSGEYEVSNLQAKMLLSLGTGWPDVRGMPNRELLESALETLKKRVACFGIQDRFNESVSLFAEKFHWKLPVYASLNQSSSKNAIDFKKEHITIISELNAVDIDLYLEAKQLFRVAFSENQKAQSICKKLGRYNLIAGPALKAGFRVSKILRCPR